MLCKEVKDPHIGFITITDVEVSKDLRMAKVFYTILGDEQQSGIIRCPYSAYLPLLKDNWVKGFEYALYTRNYFSGMIIHWTMDQKSITS